MPLESSPESVCEYVCHAGHMKDTVYFRVRGVVCVCLFSLEKQLINAKK